MEDDEMPKDLLYREFQDLRAVPDCASKIRVKET
jgi:hypothetical protein